MVNRHFIVFCIFIGLMSIVISSNHALSSEVNYHNITFKIIKTFNVYVDKDKRVAKKEMQEDDTTLYIISGLSSENIKLQVIRNNKLIYEDKLYLLSKSENNTIYLYEKTGANYINLWTIFTESKTVVCTKQYNEVDGGVRIANYISIIESAY